MAALASVAASVEALAVRNLTRPIVSSRGRALLMRARARCAALAASGVSWIVGLVMKSHRFLRSPDRPRIGEYYSFALGLGH